MSTGRDNVISTMLISSCKQVVPARPARFEMLKISSSQPRSFWYLGGRSMHETEQKSYLPFTEFEIRSIHIWIVHPKPETACIHKAESLHMSVERKRWISRIIPLPVDSKSLSLPVNNPYYLGNIFHNSFSRGRSTITALREHYDNHHRLYVCCTYHFQVRSECG